MACGGSSASSESSAASSEALSARSSSSAAASMKYELSGADLGRHGTVVVLNKDTDMPVEKNLYRIPAGKYTVITSNERLTSIFIIKDEVGVEDGNDEYPETLQYVGEEYDLTSGSNDFGSRAKEEVTIEVAADESILLPEDTDNIVVEEKFFEEKFC